MLYNVIQVNRTWFAIGVKDSVQRPSTPQYKIPPASLQRIFAIEAAVYPVQVRRLGGLLHRAQARPVDVAQPRRRRGLLVPEDSQQVVPTFWIAALVRSEGTQEKEPVPLDVLVDLLRRLLQLRVED